MLISDYYRQMNAELHGKRSYGAGGYRWAAKVADMADKIDAKSILDYGCGKATLAAAIPKYPVVNYDPAIPDWSSRPEPADLVVCLDVLEHIEPDCLDAVLDDLAGLTKQRGLLVIATRSARKVLPDGRNAHLIVKSPEWWKDAIGARFDVICSEINDDIGEVSFIVGGKHD